MNNHDLQSWQRFRLPAILVGVSCIVYLVAPRLPIGASSRQLPSGVVTTSTDHPDENNINSATYHSDATGTQPKYLSLPSVHTEGFIQKVGVDQHRQMAVPTNIHLAGWFYNSPSPGDPGLSIIDGHLDGYRQPGIFAHLATLKPGATFDIELANGVIRHFLVMSVQSLSTAQAASVLFSQVPGIKSQLNLITCGGNFNNSAGAYDHRIVVTSRYMP